MKQMKMVPIFPSNAKPSKHIVCSGYNMMSKKVSQTQRLKTTKSIYVFTEVFWPEGALWLGLSHEASVICRLDLGWKIHFHAGSLEWLGIWCQLLAGGFSLLLGLTPRLLKCPHMLAVGFLHNKWSKRARQSHNALHELSSKAIHFPLYPTLFMIERDLICFNVGTDYKVSETEEEEH